MIYLRNKDILYEIQKILPEIEIHGFDVSKYAIRNSKKEIKSIGIVFLSC